MLPTSSLNFPRTSPTNGHAVVAEQRRGEHGDELEQQIGLRREEVRHRFFKALLEVVRVRTGHAVPRLRRAEMVVVHGVQRVVLEVPAERRERAPEVQPRYQNAGDVVVHAPEQRAMLAVIAGIVRPRVVRSRQ